jgi:glycosyltransferase involved in cell wall biosynthesis
MAYPAPTTEDRDLVEARRWWAVNYGLERKEGLLAVFFGTLGRQVDLRTVFNTARLLQGKGVRFVICGTGERFEECRRLTAALDNVILPGWVDAPQIRALMEMADVGLAPYFSRGDFLASYPNKVLEYLSGGLPILSAIGGLVGDLLDEARCGLVYGGDTPAEVLARLLEELLRDPGRLRVMSDNAQRVFASRFSAANVYGEMSRYLECIAEEAREKRK